MIDTKKDQYQVALEYEMSDKQESRYFKKLTDYYLDNTVSAVFYICGNDKIEKVIRKVDLEVGQKFEAKVFTCLAEVIYRELEGVPFYNRNNSLFLMK